jgi:hypothetical protein
MTSPKRREEEAGKAYKAAREAARFSDPGSLDAANRAAVAHAQARSAVWELTRTPEENAKAQAMVNDFHERLPRTFIGGERRSGSFPRITLSPHQFGMWQAQSGPYPSEEAEGPSESDAGDAGGGDGGGE